MAADVSGNLSLTGSFTWDQDGELSSLGETILLANDTSFAENVMTVPRLAWTNGTGSGNINSWFRDQRTLAAAGNDDLDLAGVLSNPFGSTITFVRVKILIVSIVSPDGSKNLRVGPQNVANPWQGPWGGTGATVYQTVYNFMVLADNYTGWAVTGGSADTLRINNPTGDSIDYQIFIGGTV